MDIKTKLKQEKQELQKYIDADYFDYDSQWDMTLGYVNQSSDEVIAKVKQWDFSAYDNLIRHYARITLLEELSKETR